MSLYPPPHLTNRRPKPDAYGNQPITAATTLVLRAEWGLDRPLPSQYVHWLCAFAAGDWGTSYRTGRPIRDELLARLPYSLTIGLGGLALAVLLGLPLGLLAAARPGGIVDQLTRLLTVATQAVPAFWLGLLLIGWLAVEPAGCARSPAGPWSASPCRPCWSPSTASGPSAGSCASSFSCWCAGRTS